MLAGVWQIIWLSIKWRTPVLAKPVMGCCVKCGVVRGVDVRASDQASHGNYVSFPLVEEEILSS
jgi:hypothetical protein